MRLKISHVMLLMAAVLGGTVWLTRRPEGLPAAGAGPLHAAGCPLPPHHGRSPLPLQTEAPPGLTLAHAQGRINALAGFSLEARVLGRKRYSQGEEARFSPLDLALGWGPMRETAVLQQLDISQSGRWYHYRWSGQAPIPPGEIVRSSANMHMIPANDGVARALRGVREGDRIRLQGWLVNIEAADGWRWRSSLTRDDTGNGACELVYVCAIERL